MLTRKGLQSIQSGRQPWICTDTNGDKIEIEINPSIEQPMIPNDGAVQGAGAVCEVSSSLIVETGDFPKTLPKNMGRGSFPSRESRENARLAEEKRDKENELEFQRKMKHIKSLKEKRESEIQYPSETSSVAEAGFAAATKEWNLASVRADYEKGLEFTYEKGVERLAQDLNFGSIEVIDEEIARLEARVEGERRILERSQETIICLLGRLNLIRNRKTNAVISLYERQKLSCKCCRCEELIGGSKCWICYERTLKYDDENGEFVVRDEKI